MIAFRDVLERHAANPRDPNGMPRDNWSRAPWQQRTRWPAGHHSDLI